MLTACTLGSAQGPTLCNDYGRTLHFSKSFIIITVICVITVFRVLMFSKKHCKHFQRGKGRCPFNEKCFYLHAYPDGRVASPRPFQRREHSARRRSEHVDYSDDDDDDDDVLIVDEVSLYDIIELLNERVTLLADRLEHSLGPLLHSRTLSSSDDDE